MNAGENELGGMLDRVLGDPELMNTVMKLAGTLKNGTPPNGARSDDARPDDMPEGDAPRNNTPTDDISPGEIPQSGRGDKPESEHRERRESGEAEENRIRLLVALKPYLSEDRRQKADYLIRILKLLKFTDLNELAGLLGGLKTN